MYYYVRLTQNVCLNYYLRRSPVLGRTGKLPGVIVKDDICGVGEEKFDATRMLMYYNRGGKQDEKI
jgi:hypothetical protein